MLWAGHGMAWRGNPACLALWLLLCLQITHYAHQSSLILRPALGILCNPGGSNEQAKARIKQSCNLHGAVQQAGIQQKLLPKDRQCFWLRHLHILRLMMLCSLLPGMQAALWTLACPRELSSLQRYRNMQSPIPQTGENEGATGAKHRHNCLDCRELVTLAHSCLYKP